MSNSLIENDFNWSEQGYVVSISDGVAVISGLNNVLAGELVVINNNVKGLALNVEKRYVKVVIFANEASVSQVDIAERTISIVNVPVVMNLLGRVVDALGNPLDDAGDIEADNFAEVDVKAPGIIVRKSVH